MPEPVVRVSQGFFEPTLLEAVEAAVRKGRAPLELAVKALPGLLHFYMSVDVLSTSFVNVTVWESLAAAQQLDTLAEMLAQRNMLIGLGIKFQPNRNYRGLWSVEP